MSNVTQEPRRGRRLGIPILIVVLALGGAAAAWSLTRPTSPKSFVGVEGVLIYEVPNLASASTTLTGKTIDGISCRPAAKEVVRYHIHNHLTVYINGKMMRLPAGVGITQPLLDSQDSSGVFDTAGPHDCLYWLHTHAADGIIHMEAPAKGVFTLGQFFDVWGQPLGPDQVGPAKGKVVVFENAKELVGNPRETPLLPHAVIQLDVGSPVVAFRPVIFKVTGSCGAGTTGCAISFG